MEILFLLIFAPFILVIVGVVQLTRSDLIKKKNGKKLLLIGIGLLSVE